MSPEGKRTIQKLHLLSGKSYQDCRELINNLLSVIILDYLEKDSTSVPYIGTFSLKFEGDEITPKGRRAKISLGFIPDEYLLKVIGQIEDGEETEIEKNLLNKIKVSLDDIIENKN